MRLAARAAPRLSRGCASTSSSGLEVVLRSRPSPGAAVAEANFETRAATAGSLLRPDELLEAVARRPDAETGEFSAEDGPGSGTLAAGGGGGGGGGAAAGAEPRRVMAGIYAMLRVVRNALSWSLCMSMQ